MVANMCPRINHSDNLLSSVEQRTEEDKFLSKSMARETSCFLLWQQAVDHTTGRLVPANGVADTQLLTRNGINILAGEHVSGAASLEAPARPSRPLVRVAVNRGALPDSVAPLRTAAYFKTNAALRRYFESPSTSHLLPLLEVNRCTAAVTQPLPTYDFRGARSWTKASSWTKLGERPIRYRRQRRKLRGCGDCSFCNDCALPFLDGILCCLSTLLIPCLDGILPDFQAFRPSGKLGECDRITESSGGISGDPFQQIFLEHPGPQRTCGGPTFDTICLQCGDVLQSRRVDSRSFADALSPNICDKQNRLQKEESTQKIPLPRFSEESFPILDTVNQSEEEKRELRPWSCRETKHSAFPKDEAGRVVLPAFFLDDPHLSKKPTFSLRK